MYPTRLALRRLRLPAVAVAAAAALALPASASAGNLTVDHSAPTAPLKAPPGEANTLSFYRLSNTYRIQDEPAGSVPLTEIGGALCSQAEPWKYRCPAASVASANVSLGDGADTFDATVSSIAVTLTAGPGVKKITTGSGADAIDARNGSADQISCGEGADSVTADAGDAVDASCEQVDRGTFTGGDGQDGAGSGDPTTNPDGTKSPDAGGNGGNGTQNEFETPVGL